MFLDKKNYKSNQNNNEPGSNQNRINEGTIIKGDIDSKGFLRIDGIIEGNITTTSKVVIGKNGKVIGTLACDQADIEGFFEGTLRVTNLLTLRANAKINGDALVGKLSVEPGAMFNATCSMERKETANTVNKSTENYFDRSKRSQKPHPEQLN
ncbi:bactofilin family protein [Patiriisocius sp. Uisw_017]|jgi:cytoskeletal protein CcmA (bactofilin family)|uniref:bactofilin family protein n=1 Tax=Patiriisocius sp. Uisw_017 TaxID=3230968 RepID=UPI0039E78B0C